MNVRETQQQGQWNKCLAKLINREWGHGSPISGGGEVTSHVHMLTTKYYNLDPGTSQSFH